MVCSQCANHMGLMCHRRKINLLRRREIRYGLDFLERPFRSGRGLADGEAQAVRQVLGILGAQFGDGVHDQVLEGWHLAFQDNASRFAAALTQGALGAVPFGEVQGAATAIGTHPN